MPIKGLAFDRHIKLVEGILHDIVCVQLVHPADDGVHVGLVRFGEEQKFCAREGLEALQPEVLALEQLDAGRWHAWSGHGVQARGDSMNSERKTIYYIEK